MNKVEASRTRYCLQWETHPRHTFKNLCSLMEHQSLVDIAICCGNNTVHAHKCVLAAGSPYFREELEKNSTVEQVLINGFDFSVMKAIIEFMYCGETTISEEHLKYLVAAAKLFQLKGLEALLSERQEFNNTGDEIYIPPPQFLSKKPKYPSAPHPLNNIPISSNYMLKSTNYNLNDIYSQRRMKRKYIRAEAEKACAKEAQASRMALANLQKEIATTPQVNSFIIEESCTETTVENFIPHTEENFVENLSDIHQVQVVNYTDVENSPIDTKPPNMIHFTLQNVEQGTPGLTADKIKHILGNGMQSNVEIMFKTSEGNFVSVTDEVLQNLSKGGLQYQVVDENGHVGEIRDLQMLDRSPVEKTEDIAATTIATETPIVTPETQGSSFASDDANKLVPENYINPNFLTAPEAVSVSSAAASIPDSSVQAACSKEASNPLQFDSTHGFGDNVYSNSFGLSGSLIFANQDTSTGSDFSAKPIEFVPLNSNSYICSDVNNHVDEIANPIHTLSAEGYYHLKDTVLNTGEFMANLSGGTTINPDLHETSVSSEQPSEPDDTSVKKSDTALKFSPDMFFADLPNDNAVSIIDDADQTADDTIHEG